MTKEPHDSSEPVPIHPNAEKQESLRAFAGGVAQRLSNQLTALLGYASLAREGVADSHRESFEELMKAAEEITNLCKKIQLCSGMAYRKCMPVNLSEVVQDASELLQTIPVPPASLSLELATGLPQIQADPDQVKEVVVELVRNAADALDGREGRVVVRTAEAGLSPGPGVILEVADTGPGIPPEVQETLFDPFVTTRPPRLGLGLSIVLGIAHGHRASVAVRSTTGGAVFRVCFPCQQ